MRAPAQTRTRMARIGLVGSLVTAALLAAGGAHADDPGRFDRETERLRSANAELAAESQSVLLELYALESRLGAVGERIAELRDQIFAVERRQEAARTHLAIVRRTLAAAEERLAGRLRDLYVEGDPDPLSVLLGAESLDEAIATLDNLGHFARQDREIVEQVKEARRRVRAALRALAERKSELRALTAEAEAARAALARTRAARESYLARLVRERRLNEAELARLSARAEAAESRAKEIAAETASDEPAPASSSAAPVAVVSPPPAAPAAGGPGTQMTVVATGYSLPGTTATGMPVGWGVVAVDPSVIPLGTRMTIPGYGEGVAADTGGAVRGAIIDLWFPTTAQALAWGRRTVTITLH